MKKDKCWCTFKVHLPGEYKRHQKAKNQADRTIELVKAAEERGKKK
jgi:hypothetical protein